MRRLLSIIFILTLFIVCAASTASATGLKVQLMEEGTEYTQFFGGWPWDIQPFTIPFQQADDRVVCGVWMPKAAPAGQDCVLAAVERGDKVLLVGGIKTENGWKKTILSDRFFRENQEFSMVGIRLADPDNSSMFRPYAAVAYDNEYFCIAITDMGEFFFAHYIRMDPDGSVYDASLIMGVLEVTETSESGSRILVSEPIMNPGRLDMISSSDFPTNVDDTMTYIKKYPAMLPENHVIIQGVNLRKEPTGQSQSLGKYDFALAEYLGEKDGTEVPWVHVRIGNTEGWVSSRYVRKNVREISESVSWLAMKIGAVNGETMLYGSLGSSDGSVISAPFYMYVLADCGSQYHVLIPSAGFEWPIDWNGTYGYVQKNDIVIRTSILDLKEPSESSEFQLREQSRGRTEEEIVSLLKEHCYMNPDGGRLVHLNKNCISVHPKYLPLTEVEYTDDIAQKYEICSVCCFDQ